MRNAAERHGSKVSADPKIREPAFHGAILRAPTRIEMAKSNTQEKCEAKARIFVLRPFRSRAIQALTFGDSAKGEARLGLHRQDRGARGISGRCDRFRPAGWRRSLHPTCRRSPRQRLPVRVPGREPRYGTDARESCGAAELRAGGRWAELRKRLHDRWASQADPIQLAALQSLDAGRRQGGNIDVAIDDHLFDAGAGLRQSFRQDVPPAIGPSPKNVPRPDLWHQFFRQRFRPEFSRDEVGSQTEPSQRFAGCGTDGSNSRSRQTAGIAA